MPSKDTNKAPDTGSSASSVQDLDFQKAVELLHTDYPGLDKEYTFNLLREEFPELGRSKVTRAEKAAREDARIKRVPWPETNYTEKYKEKPFKPRSSKRPPRQRANAHPAPMTFETFQRSVFQGHDVHDHPRPEPYQQQETYVAPTNRMNGLSVTQHDFVEKPLEEVVQSKAVKGNYIPNEAKFSSNTTNKEHYKNWVPERKLVYGEIPSFAGSILFPDKAKFPESVTKTSFPGAFGYAKPEMVHMKGGNLRVEEGDHDHLTVHNDTYRGFDAPVPRTRMIINQPTVSDHERGRFLGITQSMDDFPRKDIAKSRPVHPLRETINLKFDRKARFDTEQRVTYQGHDARDNPRDKPFKRDPETYTKPGQKFETNTTNTLCYTPKDLNAAASNRVLVPFGEGIMVEQQPFHGQTTQKEHFQKYEMQRRVRYGDFHETYKNVRPVEGLSNMTQNRAVHTPKVGEMRPSFKPPAKPIEDSGDQDFRTVNRLTYVQHQPRPSKALLRAMLKQSMQKRKMAKSNKSVVLSNENTRVACS